MEYSKTLVQQSLQDIKDCTGQVNYKITSELDSVKMGLKKVWSGNTADLYAEKLTQAMEMVEETMREIRLVCETAEENL